MTTSICFSLTVLLVCTSLGAAPVVIERGPHHRVWQTVSAYQPLGGESVSITNSYVELGTGLHYEENGVWRESKAEIEVVNGIAVARHGQHRAAFARNINSRGAVELVTPEGKRFRSHILGLAYTDSQTLQTVLIAELKNSQGVIVGQNQVYYEDAFDGDCIADVRYTYKLGSFEQDIILITAPPSPAEYGLNPETTRLEVLTEFIEAPEPKIQEMLVRKKTDDPRERGLVDQHLDFGVMKIGAGHVFPTRDEDPLAQGSTPTGKTWEQIGERLFLIEQVDFDSLIDELGKLPQGVRNQNRAPAVPQPGRRLMAALRAPEGSAGTWKGTEFAQFQAPRPGLVVDYLTVNSSLTNYVFRGDMTYWVSASINLYGTTVIEGGAVIKFPSGGSVMFNVYGPVDCRTTSWHPAVFTARDDNTVGEIISGSTGNPTGTYAAYNIAPRYTGGISDFHDLRIRYGVYGFAIFQNVTNKIRNVQISDCTRASAWQSGVMTDYENILFHKVDTAFYNVSSSAVNRVQHATLHRVRYLLNATNYTLQVTNSLLISVTNNNSYVGAGIGFSSSDSGIFETVGSGAHYLPSWTTYRDVGTTTISPGLLADLKTRTTYPPQIIGTNIINSIVLAPFAIRDTDAPDLGYHYDPADYLLSDINVTNATLTLTNGVVVTLDSRGTNFGLRLQSGAHIVSSGSALILNRIVRSSAVQDLLTGTNGYPSFADVNPAPANPTSVRMRFTDLPLLAGNTKHFFHSLGQGTLSNIALVDSQLRGGTLQISAGISNTVLALTNTLLDRVNATIHEYKPGTGLAFNNLFREGVLNVHATNSGWNWKDNLFDKTALANTGISFTHNYNSYVTNFGRLQAPYGANDQVLTNSPAYQQAYLGRYYLPASSPQLIAQGSLSDAGVRGLYHYTTTTNQVKETNSVLDIGLHYVALNSDNQPIDTDNDGLADYIEDVNGNGLRDATETDWTTADTDQDGRSDSQELNEGTDPLNGNSFTPVRLALFDFDGANCVNDHNQLPCCHEVDHRISWKGTAICVTNGTGNGMAYKGVCHGGKPNFSARQGTVRFWYKPNWNTANGGPGASAALVHLGAYTSPSVQGLWCIALNSAGNQLQFMSHTNGAGEMNCYAPVSWLSNRWHQVVVTYTPSNSMIYIDGACRGTNSAQGVRYYPNALESAGDFRFGFNGATQQAKGTFDEVETFNYPLSRANIQSNFHYWATSDTDTDGLVNIRENEIGTSVTNPDTDSDGLNDGGEIMASSNPYEPDDDDDGLTDVAEVYYGTNPNKSDTDDDGRSDGAEVTGAPSGNDTGTDPLIADMDNDGAPDGYEILVGTNPKNPSDGSTDTDQDGMPDWWEQKYGLNLNDSNDAWSDPDGDFLANFEEYSYGGRPNTWDTDNDTLNDGDELWVHTTQLTNADTDSDGWTDNNEIVAGGNPHNQDSDGDGMRDGWELGVNLNPLWDDASEDPDVDGVTNLAEFLAGSNPHLADTDGDWLSDFEELNPPTGILGTNPAKADTDGDGIPDFDEINLEQTNPALADTDNDGRTDWQELNVDGTSYLDPQSYDESLLGIWRFNESDLRSERYEDIYYQWDPIPALFPKTTISVMQNGNAGVLAMDNVFPSSLAYWECDPTNSSRLSINLRRGSVRFWFQPLWTSSSLNGGGPGHEAHLLAVGRSTDPEHWVLFLDSGGSVMTFATKSNGISQTVFQANVQFRAKRWYDIMLTYSDGENNYSKLYIDQEPIITSGSSIQRYPGPATRAQYGFNIGSDVDGMHQAIGLFDNIETYNYQIAPLMESGVPGGQQPPPATCNSSCKLYPIAVRQSHLPALNSTFEILEEKDQPGHIGWLTWTGDNKPETLAASLTTPNSCTYFTGASPTKDQWVYGRPGVSNADKVKTAMENLERLGDRGEEITVVVWSGDPQGSGDSMQYQVFGFAQLLIEEVIMTGSGRTIQARYMGAVTDTCGNTPPEINPPPPLPPLAICHETSTPAIALTVTDEQDAPAALELSAAATALANPDSSVNLDLPSTLSFAFAGTDASRALTVSSTGAEVGKAEITITVEDTADTTDTTTVVLTVTPCAVPDGYSVNEDTLLSVTAPGVIANDTGEAGQTMSAELNTTTANGVLTLNPDGSFTYTPNSQFFGTDSFSYWAKQRGIRSKDPVTVIITVNPINDPPTLNPIDPITVLEDSGPRNVSLSGITWGPANETGQTPITVAATSSNPTLIPNPPVSYTSPNTTATLTFTPNADRFGTATITVTVTDNGPGTPPHQRTFSRQFIVTVTGVNDPPTLSIANSLTMTEDGPRITLNFNGITAGPFETGQTPFLVTATSSDPALIPNPIVNYSSPGSSGSLTLYSHMHAAGVAIITVKVQDAGGQANGGVDFIERQVEVYVNGVPDFPAIAVLDTTPGIGFVSESISLFTSYPAVTPSDIMLSFDRTRAFLPDSTRGLLIVDASNPRLPEHLATYAASVGKVAVSSNPERVYVTVGNQLRIINIQDPHNPQLIDSYTETAVATIRGLAIARNGARAYLALDTGMRIVDLTVSPPVARALWSAAGLISHVGVGTDNNRAFILGSSYESSSNPFIIMDVQNANSPFAVSSFDLPEESHSCLAVAEDGSFALAGLAYDGIQRIRLVPPYQLEAHFMQQDNAYARDIAVSKDKRFAYIANNLGFHLWSVSSSTSPSPINNRVEAPHHVAFTRDLTVAYVAYQSGAFEILDLGTSQVNIAEDSISQPAHLFASDVENGISWQPVVSDNLPLLPPSGLQFSGAQSDSPRTLFMTPMPNQSGTGLLTLTVHDFDADFKSEYLRVAVGGVNDPPSLLVETLEPDVSIFDSEPTWFAQTVALSLNGQTIFVADEWHGLRIYSIVNNQITSEIWSATEVICFGLALSAAGDKLYVADYLEGLRIYDVSVPASPVQLSLEPGSGYTGIALSRDGHKAFLTSDYGMTIIDVFNASDPITRGAITTSTLVRNPPVFSPAGNLAYLPATDYLLVIDVSNPYSPQQVAAQWANVSAVSITPDASTLVTVGAWFLTTWDLLNPSQPNAFGWMYLNQEAYDIKLSRDAKTAYVTSPAAALEIVDLSNLVTPDIRKTVPGGAYGSYRLVLSRDDNRIYSANLADGISIIDVGTYKLSIEEDTTSPIINMKVNDLETPAGNLFLSGASGNPALMPNGGIRVLGSSGQGRTVTLTPAEHQTGTALLTFTVNDLTGGTAEKFLNLTVTPRNDPPIASAGPDRTHWMSDSPTITIEGTATDPDGPFPLTITWSQVSGPTIALITPGSPPERPQVTFNEAGTYVFKIAVSDGQYTASATATINVKQNLPPVVDAGPNRQAIRSTSLIWSGTVTDDGARIPTPTITWRLIAAPTGISVPAVVSSTLSVTYNFQTAGSYTFELEANDNQFTPKDTMQVTVLDDYTKVWTRSVDFAEGNLHNVNFNEVPHQLQLNKTTTPFPFVWIAASDKGTVFKIDANNGQILGEYATAPGTAADRKGKVWPSRTAVDSKGNLWIANSDDVWLDPLDSARKGSITRIGLIIGGTRGTKVPADAPSGYTFTPDPNGEWLAPPFIYSTCVDRDGDGLIRTSRGKDDIRPWPNTGSALAGGVVTAQDESIINYVRVLPTANGQQ